MLKLNRVAIALFLLGVLVGSAQNRITEGARPYTPSRLQWLAVYMQAAARKDISVADGYSIGFAGLESENTILIYVRYLPSVNREIMNGAIETARMIIDGRAKAEGWSSWLKIREDVKMAGDLQ
jgi:hypothetical protein